MREIQETSVSWAESWDELASKGNRCPRGTVSYTVDNGILLRLYASVWSTEMPAASEKGTGASKRLYCLGDDGRYFILDEAMLDGIMAVSKDDNVAHSMAARAKRLLISVQPFDPEADIESVMMTIAGLSEWVGNIDDLPFIIYEDEEIIIEVRPSDDSEDGSAIEVVPKVRMSIVRLDEVVSTLASAMTFCCCFYTDVTELDVTFKGNTEPVACILAFVKGPGPDESIASRVPLMRGVLAGRSQTFFREWLHPSHDVSVLRERLLSLMFRGWRLPVDVEFLAAAQVLEALTKTGRNNYVLSKEEFERRRDAVLTEIDDDGLRDWAKSALTGNYRSAPELLEEFISEHPDTMRWIGIGNTQLFQKRHKRTRNYLTHLKGRPEKGILEGGELRWHTDAVLLLCYCSVARFCGIPEGEVLHALEGAGFMRRERLQVARLYPDCREG